MKSVLKQGVGVDRMNLPTLDLNYPITCLQALVTTYYFHELDMQTSPRRASWGQVKPYGYRHSGLIVHYQPKQEGS